MPSLIAKVTSHVGQTGARSCRSICRGTPKFRAMVSLRNSDFLRSIVVKLRFRPRSLCNLIWRWTCVLRFVVPLSAAERPPCRAWLQPFSLHLTSRLHTILHPRRVYERAIAKARGSPQAAVLVQRFVTHVRYHCSAEWEYQRMSTQPGGALAAINDRPGNPSGNRQTMVLNSSGHAFSALATPPAPGRWHRAMLMPLASHC
jgi:hypothetical protein